MMTAMREDGRQAGLTALQLLAFRIKESEQLASRWQIECSLAFEFTVECLRSAGVSSSAVGEWSSGFREASGFTP